MTRRRSKDAPAGAVHGVLVVDKPRGPTSHDIVAAVRRQYGTRRVGHAGTLDPMATGVLVVLLGEGTKLSAHLTREKKRYRARISLGTATDTLDAEGSVTRRKALSRGWLDEATLRGCLEQERERTLQLPPSVSAIKVGGRSAHERVRKGENVVLEPRDVEVHEIRLTRFDDVIFEATDFGRGPASAPERPLNEASSNEASSNETIVEVELLVSKGYYVRALARDLGERLGVPAHLSALRRTASGAFTLEGAHSWPLTEGPAEAPAPPLLSLLEAAGRALPIVELSGEDAARAADGKPLSLSPYAPELPNDPMGRPIGLRHRNRLIGLAEARQDGTLRIVRGIHDPGSATLPHPQSSVKTLR